MRISICACAVMLIGCGRVNYDALAIDAGNSTIDASVDVGVALSVALGLGGSGTDTADGVAVDQADNIYVVGFFGDTVDFGNGPLVSNGIADMFLASYTQQLSPRWSLAFGGGSSDRFDAITGAQSGVFVMGEFEGTVDLGGGNLSSAGGDDLIFARFGADGSHQWSRGHGSAGDEDTGSDVVVDAAGNGYFVSAFFSSVDFGGGPLVSSGSRDIVVVSYDSAGGHRWSRRFGGAGVDVGDGVGVDTSGNVYVAGNFAGSVDFGGGPLVSAGGSDIFVISLDSSGAHRWSQRFGGPAEDTAENAAIGPDGNLYVTGSLQDTVDFGGGPLTSAGGEDIFLASFGPGGAHRWSQRYGGAGQDQAESLELDAEGNFYVAGYFSETLSIESETLVSAGMRDILVASFDSTGELRWARGFGGAGDDKGRGVAITGAGAVAVTGAYAETVDFGDGPVTSAGDLDSFLILLDQVGL